MNCYPLNTESHEKDLHDDLKTANYQLSVDGIEFTPVSGSQKTAGPNSCSAATLVVVGSNIA